jgi:hypothetical protein
MTDTRVTNGYLIYVPTFREKFWRRMGFRFHLGDEPEDTDGMPGWQKTEVRLRFNIPDRIRLLLTGRLFVGLAMHTDVPSPNVIKTRIDWEIKAPGDTSRR